MDDDDKPRRGGRGRIEKFSLGYPKVLLNQRRERGMVKPKIRRMVLHVRHLWSRRTVDIKRHQKQFELVTRLRVWIDHWTWGEAWGIQQAFINKYGVKAYYRKLNKTRKACGLRPL